ncbi:hypothetical protein CUJ84_pRLN1000445 (plasmid) [Rhizobium leguminosarum]|uniref:Uncharacterized protein n=1 Tax=Rhizobium leguminosarum TaxID=384 RepID=A0A2K9ZCD2_RHILE|nr:hypothetical protein CUJ84_pRLN1000445 [Rhizobium leguminosarum]
MPCLSHPSHWHLGPLVSRCSAGLFRVGLRRTKIFESDVMARYTTLLPDTTRLQTPIL